MFSLIDSAGSGIGGLITFPSTGSGSIVMVSTGSGSMVMVSTGSGSMSIGRSNIGILASDSACSRIETLFIVALSLSGLVDFLTKLILEKVERCILQLGDEGIISCRKVFHFNKTLLVCDWMKKRTNEGFARPPSGNLQMGEVRTSLGSTRQPKRGFLQGHQAWVQSSLIINQNEGFARSPILNTCISKGETT